LNARADALSSNPVKRQMDKDCHDEDGARKGSASILRLPHSMLAALRRDGLLALALVAGTILVYCPVWHGGFAWDDDLHITENRLVAEPGGMGKIWFSREAPQYYPLVFTSFRLEYALWGLHASGYHWINILLHACSSVLLWRVLRRLSVPGAWLAAAVFAVHPVNVESVAWISERKNTLCMVFYLLSLLLYLRSEDPAPAPSSPRITHHASRPTLPYWLSVFAFVLALLSKTAVAPLPFVLLGLAWWRRGRVTAADLWRSAPFFGAAVVLGLLTVWFEHLKTHAPGVMRSESFWSQLASAGWAVWFYLYKAVLPIHLNFIYPRWQINPLNPLSYVPGLLLVALGLLLWRFRRGWGRACLFCLFYFVIMLLPVLGFMNIGFLLHSLVADHWQYFSIIGPITLAVAFFRLRLCARHSTGNRIGIHSPGPVSPAGVLLASTVLLALSVLTWCQSAWYADARVLWQHTLARNPGAWMAHHQLGFELAREGKLAEAISHYQEALSAHPDFPIAEINLGVALQRQGRQEEARAHFLKARQRQPDVALVHNNIGSALYGEGKFAEAIPCFEEALRLKPHYPDARNSLGLCLWRLGREQEALDQFAAVLGQGPDAKAHYNTGVILFSQGKLDQARGSFLAALQIKPDSAEARNNLGNLLVSQGRLEEAGEQFAAAVRSAPDFVEARCNLAQYLAGKGAVGQAIEHYTAALRAKPDQPEVHLGLAKLLEQAGRLDEAARHYAEAIRLRPDLAEAHNNLSNLAASQNNPGLALTHGLATVRLKPEWAEAHYNLANALFLQNKIEDAAAQYSEALRLQTNYFEARQNLGFMLEKLGRNKESADQYGEIIRLRPDFAAAYDRLAAVLAKQSRFPEAIKAAEEGIQRANSAGQNNLADGMKARLQAYRAGKQP
ncbi:MAG: tetratricopeptide repeat protein, partial [Verrucomicrobiota bacterium]